jgi:hypothetical protein
LLRGCGEDGVFLAFRAEIEDLKVKRAPLEPAANALYQSFEQTIPEHGFQAACAWSNKVGLDPKLEEIEDIDRRAGRIVQQMLEFGPETPTSIAAVALALKDEALGHLWERPKGDRDWDAALLARFLDGLISLLPRLPNEEHLPRLA